jgi:hypothetical protein
MIPWVGSDDPRNDSSQSRRCVILGGIRTDGDPSHMTTSGGLIALCRGTSRTGGTYRSSRKHPHFSMHFLRACSTFTRRYFGLKPKLGDTQVQTAREQLQNKKRPEKLGSSKSDCKGSYRTVNAIDASIGSTAVRISLSHATATRAVAPPAA